MARYTGPSCKLCRREGEHLYLKGHRCVEGKCTFDKRGYPPGEHGRRRIKQSEYSIQLRAKQKAKRIYGLPEKQFRNLYEVASRKKGITGDNLLTLLESRLDNVVYRAGFAASRKEARQLISHGHFLIGDRKVDIPSYRLKEGQIITTKDRSKKIPKLAEVATGAVLSESPSWLNVQPKVLTVEVLHLPAREEITSTIQDKLIVELYSK